VGIVQLNQIKTRNLDPLAGPLVDVSDAVGDEETTRLTRGLAAWVLTQIAGISDEDGAAAVTDGFDDNGIECRLG